VVGFRTLTISFCPCVFLLKKVVISSELGISYFEVPLLDQRGILFWSVVDFFCQLNLTMTIRPIISNAKMLIMHSNVQPNSSSTFCTDLLLFFSLLQRKNIFKFTTTMLCGWKNSLLHSQLQYASINSFALCKNYSSSTLHYYFDLMALLG
jgi:hypothetical protein